MSKAEPGLRKSGKRKQEDLSPVTVAAGSIDVAYERIYAAIIDHSLPPGARLVENRLCEIFGLGRTRVRQVLQKLASERLVTLLPNRGAIVAAPTVQDALDIFEARRLLEPGIVQRFVERATRADIQRIRDHLQKEKVAAKRNDRRSAIRLSGDFHLIIAECAGNATLLELLRELVSRSSLIIALYQEAGSVCCPPDEHQELVTALEKRKADAAQLMLHHLEHVLADLRLEEPPAPGVDLLAVLGGAVN
ncbi:GntR family transcriptional regulator [Solimonas marina]|uniref:GntR family transcriptional regulator n=1 Tax=Solimonas marina TaxID=2714601 RepID=A0A969WCW5_9GAMM|nr:GntR family transcriptional regulator [Solimonas marina]NKF24238.1 GntR family transcriptional regulator [Solimonas marina]